MQNPTLTHLEYCTYCPKMCRHACPVSEAAGRETWIPQAKMATLNHARKGQLPWTFEATAPIWACTGCRHCTEYCLHGVEPGPTLFAGRAEAMRRGAGHPALERFADGFRARELRQVRALREALPAERFAETAPLAWWPGCDASPDGRAELALLDRVAGAAVPLVDAPVTCGGYPLYAAGLLDELRGHARRVAEALARYRTVVMGCAACAHVVRAIYPAEGVRVPSQVLHVTEYLGGLSERIPETVTRPEVWYHDPCHVARHLGAVDAPRRLLERVATVRELAWSGRDADCCGAGGLLPETLPEVADAMAGRQLAEVAAAGGGQVVTSSRMCARMLARNAPAGVVVRELVELLEERTRPRRV